MSRILLRRGNKADLPVLNAGEPGFATDTKELYIGTATGNQKMVAAAPTAPTFIAPTLLNGWVNLAGYTAGYYKDDLNNVRIVARLKTGTMGQVMFVLPAGYRPLATTLIPAASNNSTADVVCNLIIENGGNVYAYYGSNIGIDINLSFRAGL